MSEPIRKVIVKTKENNVVYTLKKMKILEDENKNLNEENKNLNEQVKRMNNNFEKIIVVMKEAEQVIRNLKMNIEEKDKTINECIDTMFVYEVKLNKQLN